MENTLENKEKFFAQYYGQGILIKNPNHKHFKNSLYKNTAFERDGWENGSVLSLKPLSSITDEEVEIIGLDTHYNKSESVYKNADDFLRTTNSFGFLTQFESDYLRSKGYALPWMGLSVEKLQEYGWVKLV